MRSDRHRGLVMLVSFFLYTACAFAFAQSQNFALSLLFLALAGIFMLGLERPEQHPDPDGGRGQRAGPGDVGLGR